MSDLIVRIKNPSNTLLFMFPMLHVISPTSITFNMADSLTRHPTECKKCVNHQSCKFPRTSLVENHFSQTHLHGMEWHYVVYCGALGWCNILLSVAQGDYPTGFVRIVTSTVH